MKKTTVFILGTVLVGTSLFTQSAFAKESEIAGESFFNSYSPTTIAVQATVDVQVQNGWSLTHPTANSDKE